ncbi:MAG: Rieske (2Fe-2S) protein [Planctomycetes bacterium]|nr:Rieske (2Fe-2S) protein [Planctomycetota bacterium]
MNQPDNNDRREFLRVCVIGGAALLGAGASAWAVVNPANAADSSGAVETLPLVPVLRLSALEKNKPLALEVTLSRRQGWRMQSRRQHVFIVRTGDGGTDKDFLALSPVCPHKGCSVQAHEKDQRFVCPCHDAQFGFDGELKEGPAQRGLDPLTLTVREHEGADWLFVTWQDFVLDTSERTPRQA